MSSTISNVNETIEQSQIISNNISHNSSNDNYHAGQGTTEGENNDDSNLSLYIGIGCAIGALVIIALIIIIVIHNRNKREVTSAETDSVELPEENVLNIATIEDLDMATITIDYTSVQVSENDPFDMDFEENFI